MEAATYDGTFRVRHDGTTGWQVYLPHQCEEWLITPEAHEYEVIDGRTRYITHPVSIDTAIEAMRNFIVDALAAYLNLLQGREYGVDDE